MIEAIPKTSILYIDDEPNNLVSFQAFFRTSYHLFTLKNVENALEIIHSNNIDIIISDQRMGPVNGIDFLIESKIISPKSLRILITAYSDAHVYKDGINLCNLFRCLEKPFDWHQISLAISDAEKVISIRRKGENLMSNLTASAEKLSASLVDQNELKKIISFYSSN